MKFRKRPVVVEAYQTDKEMIIHTLEGDMRANVGDWIITGLRGEQYPCKPDIFEKTYERIDLEQDVITIEAKTNWWRYVAIAFGLFVLLYLFCGANVPNKGNGADKVRTEIKAAGQANKELQDRLESATVTVEQLQGSISKAETASERIAENLDRAEQLNRECQQILREVRSRSEEERKNY